MGAETGIAWTDHTFNPWWGCVRVSPGCEHCYAEAWDARWRGGHWGPQAPRRFFGDAHWNEPQKWNREAERDGRRARVFCASMADVFEDRRDLDEQRIRLWNLIIQTPHLDWQLLTKRPENLRKLLPWEWTQTPERNVWLGTTVEDQCRADERIELLAQVPAAIRFLSVEPLLGPVDFGNAFDPAPDRSPYQPIDWVIVGGESDQPGQPARPCALGWIADVVAQCRAGGVPVFVKQLGSRVTDVVDDGRTFVDWRMKHGGKDPAQWPARLRVRQFPEVR